MDPNKTVTILLGITFGSMPFWLNFLIIPARSVRIRKAILVSLFVFYNLLLIYLLNSLTPKSFGDIYVPYVTFCTLFLHWLFVAYTVYQLWPRQK